MSSLLTRRTQKDRVSVSLVPEDSLNSTFECPHLHSLFDETREAERLPIAQCDTCEDFSADSKDRKNSDAIVREIAEWLELVTEQENPMGKRTRQIKRLLPDVGQLSAMLAAGTHSQDLESRDRASLEPVIHLIALHLLASCYTLLPGSSADCLPIFRQKTASTVVTALRLHLKYRSSPAAGHHARNASETSPWPGLYRGSSFEDRLAEKKVEGRHLESRQYRQLSDKDSGQHRTISESGDKPEGSKISTTHKLRQYRHSDSDWGFSASGWSDGPASKAHSDSETGSAASEGSSSASSSRSRMERSLLGKIKWQRSPQRKPRKPILGHFSKGEDERQPQTHRKLRRNLLRRSTHPDVPSGSDFRRTQSAPRETVEERQIQIPKPEPVIERASSTPAPIPAHLIVPEIRRISATTIDENESAPHAPSAWDHTHTHGVHLKPKIYFTTRRQSSPVTSPVSPMTTEEREAFLEDWLNKNARRITEGSSQEQFFWAHHKALGNQSGPDDGPGSASGIEIGDVEERRHSSDSEEGADMLRKRKSGCFRAEDLDFRSASGSGEDDDEADMSTPDAGANMLKKGKCDKIRAGDLRQESYRAVQAATDAYAYEEVPETFYPCDDIDW